MVWSWKVLGGKRCDCSRIWQLLVRCHQPLKLEEFYWSTPRLWFWGGRRDRTLLPHFVQLGLEEDIPCSNLRTGCPMSAPLESGRLGLEKSISKTSIKLLLVKEIILFSFKAVMQNQNRITMMISLSFWNFWLYLGSELAFEGTAVSELLEEFLPGSLQMGSSPEGTEEIGQERQLLPKRPQPRRPESQKDYVTPSYVVMSSIILWQHRIPFQIVF